MLVPTYIVYVKLEELILHKDSLFMIGDGAEVLEELGEGGCEEDNKFLELQVACNGSDVGVGGVSGIKNPVEQGGLTS